MATFSVQARYVNRYNYLFYLSKYYEVIDSIILLLKGKKVGQLQSYHHAGALISMWIAVRFGSANVWGEDMCALECAPAGLLNRLFYDLPSLYHLERIRAYAHVHL